MNLRFLKPSLNWLLITIPAVLLLEFLSPESHSTIFLLSCLAIIPLAGWMGKATEHIAERTGEGIGGLLNATFGNAAELIIALMALRSGLHDVVKASITGSIIGNILLVLGVAFLAGGLRFKIQRFNAAGARIRATMLTLAAIALIIPAVFHWLGGPAVQQSEADLSLEISVVLIITYALSLVFSLRTHRQLFGGKEPSEPGHSHVPTWSIARAVTVLFVSTALIALMSEILVASVEETARTFGMTSVFIGVIIVAVIGNAAEHSTAVLVALKDRMDLCLAIAIGSSIQIALFVAPVLVFASYVLGPHPMDLVFTV
ncbi:MAG: calcium/proton exchanger, partial [Ignavibacteria bacterium]|nr:calcium/proton exchanger [Ignavibacteria bacterium]